MQWQGPGVVVETAKGQIQAKCAVIAVSTGVLASGDIRFVPELPTEKQDAIWALPLGNYNRIRLEIDRAVFPEDVTERVVVERAGHPPIQISLGAYGFNCAIGIVAGRHADWLERAGTDASREAVIDALCYVFGNDIVRVSRATCSLEPTVHMHCSRACQFPGGCGMHSHHSHKTHAQSVSSIHPPLAGEQQESPTSSPARPGQ